MENLIPEELYKKIEQEMPIPCVDILVRFNNKLLLLKRNNEPAKKIWFVPGGRILKNEKIEQAVKRVLKEETGLIPINMIQTGAMSHIWKNKHTISIFYVVDVKTNTIKLNNEHSKYVWIKELNDTIHPYIKEMTLRSNFFE